MPDPLEYEPEPFRPAWWLPGPHAHTIAGRFIRKLDHGPLKSERIELPDGDFVDVHEGPYDLPDTAPAVVILHGLEGCSSSNYVATVARELAGHGVRAIRFNFRGCSGEMNRLPRFYHAGDTEDLQYVLARVRQRFSGVPLGAIGFSLGGNVLLKYLGEQAQEARETLSAAVAVSVPFDLAAGTRQLERRGLTWVYTQYFMRKLRAKAAVKRELLAPHCEIDRAIASRKIREYDDALTSQLHGFGDAWNYYQQSSCAQFIVRIHLPTLILHAMDDPFLPPDAVPLQAIRENPWIVDGTARKGGHVGFITGSPWRPRFWAEEEGASFLATALHRASRQARAVSPGSAK